MRIQIVDLKINNIKSLIRAFENIGTPANIKIVSDVSDQEPETELLVLPGIGNFGAAMEVVRNKNLDLLIREHLINGGKILGICLGMQLLLEESEESPGIKGLEIISGSVRKLSARDDRVPNVGWNELNYSRQNRIRLKMKPEANFYFTHSFFSDVPSEFVLATSSHGNHSFPAVIANQVALGMQFHPEKSGGEGILFLKEILEEFIN